MRFEFSAGTVVYTYVVDERRFLFMKTSDGNLGMPKGHIEKGETSREAAIRETLEESGLGVKLDPYYSNEDSYVFKKKSELIKKHVVFYLSRVADGSQVSISPEHVGYEWLSVKDYEKRGKFKNSISMIKAASDYIDRLEDMESLNQEYKRLPKKSGAWNLSDRLVPGEGPLNAKVMIIGQAPGRTEDETLRPFVGAAGKLLDSLIRKAGLKRENVYITSVTQFFPPENRLPTDDETELCLPFLKRQISIIKPKIMVLLGNYASKNIAYTEEVMKNHGKLIKSKEFGCYMFVTLHPAAAVRIKSNMPVIEDDFAKLKEIIKND